MNNPMLRAEGVILDLTTQSVLVQCDNEETFYRFPGGSVEFGETAAQAIQRELIEEFDLLVIVDKLATVIESIVHYDGKQRHDCVLMHWCRLTKDIDTSLPIQHNEHKEIILVKKTFEQLKLKPVYPEGILEVIASQVHDKIHHLVITKDY